MKSHIKLELNEKGAKKLQISMGTLTLLHFRQRWMCFVLFMTLHSCYTDIKETFNQMCFEDKYEHQLIDIHCCLRTEYCEQEEKQALFMSLKMNQN